MLTLSKETQHTANELFWATSLSDLSEYIYGVYNPIEYMPLSCLFHTLPIKARVSCLAVNRSIGFIGCSSWNTALLSRLRAEGPHAESHQVG